MIEDYALIGDCETAALVGRDGSIDWLCWPRFDSPACFAALVGTREHGRWQICPVEPYTVTRQYRGESLILETQYTTASGVAVIVDMMPPRTGDSNLVRIVYGISGTVAMRTELIIRFGYGASVPWVTKLPDGALRAIAGPDQILVRTQVPLRGEGEHTLGEFVVRAGESVPFSMAYGLSHLVPPPAADPYAGLADTEAFWSEWAGKSRFPPGPHRDLMMRSLITLKGLTYAPTGGMVAAPTTSLPETLGGSRNWDYRFCWLRDATLALLALMNGGYYDEATAWREWLLRAVAGSPGQAQIMYGLAGERALHEVVLDHLPGYENSLPVRTGNAAHGQLQLDVFGDVMNAFYMAHMGGVPTSVEAWAVQQALLAHLETVWRTPDRGIWESRGEPRHYTFSKVMAWLAFDRGIRLAQAAKLEAPVDHWIQIAAEIHAEVCAQGFDAKLGSFTQSYGSNLLDGSLLLIPIVGFLPAEDPRVQGTLRAIEQRLVSDGLVMRHDPAQVEPETGLTRHGEGAFLACTFWLADVLIMSGRRAEGEAIFQRLLSLRNDVGLLAEEYDVRARRLVGNFPQAFSHLALCTTATFLYGAAGGNDGMPIASRTERNASVH